MLLGEVIAPELPALAIPILEILLWAIALGMLVLLLYLTHILTWLISNTVGKLPGVGSILDGLASGLSSMISNTLASAISGVDKQIAFWWYTLGDIVSWTVKEIRAHANVLEIMASVLVGAAGLKLIGKEIGAVRKLVGAIRHTAALALSKAVALEHALDHPDTGPIGKALHLALAPLVSRIGAVEKWIGGAGGALAGEIHGVIEPDIAALKERATQLENEAIRVYRDATGAWHAVNVEALAAAIVIALPSLGLQWLRCNSLGSSTAARGCGLWGGLEEVLSLLVDTALLASACQILPLVETAVSEVAVPIVDALTGIGAGLCAGNIGAPDPLPVPRLYLPPHPSLSVHVA